MSAYHSEGGNLWRKIKTMAQRRAKSLTRAKVREEQDSCHPESKTCNADTPVPYFMSCNLLRIISAAHLPEQTWKSGGMERHDRMSCRPIRSISLVWTWNLTSDRSGEKGGRPLTIEQLTTLFRPHLLGLRSPPVCILQIRGFHWRHLKPKQKVSHWHWHLFHHDSS